MALPKLNVTIHETILPSTERVIKFRPFLVKEEKLLLTALEDTSESSMMNAIKSIINNCVQEKLEVDKLPIFDIEYLFLQLRAKSVGEEIEVGIKCPKCNTTVPIMVNTDEIKVSKPKGHDRKVMITDEIGVMLSYPIITTDGITSEDGMAIVKDCIDMIFTKEETFEKGSFSDEEITEFVESMDTKQFLKIRKFFEEMPKLKHDVKINCLKCKDGGEQTITLEGLSSFFD
jgi:hypothetical protein